MLEIYKDLILNKNLFYFSIFMNRTLSHLGKREYVFSELSNLRLHDIKAQKKTMSMKKFRNIPLNNQ